MTDDTMTTTESTDTAPAGDAAASPQKRRWASRTTGGQTYLDRYVMPLLTPVIAVAVIIFFVTNISRLLLASHGRIAITVASIVAVTILGGSAALAAAPKMRAQSLAVFAGVAVLAVMFTGFLTVGHAQERKEAVAEACKPVAATVAVVPLASIKLDKSSYSAKAGCVEITYDGAPGHTLAFVGGGPTTPLLESNKQNADRFSWTLTPGTYHIHCTVTGHEAMQADLVVK